jgi:trans-2,3-dihydro-3-hydroxyanthranilate isomerase
MKFFILDVFTQEKYAGNQLAVFIQKSELSTQKMQKIAKEMNFSETTFITSTNIREGGYDVRIFTPNQELNFAGHPTLGTAYILQKEIVKQAINQINLNLQVGQIPVTLYYLNENVEELWMQQKPPNFYQNLTVDALAEVLNLDSTEIDLKYPIQEVSTGIPFIIVPLKTHSSLKRIKINIDKYFELVSHTEAKAILVFCPETNKPENDLSVRVFADAIGVPEDPATGSANGCLAGYLVKYAYFGADSIDLRVEQGYEIGRPSLLLLKAQQTDTEIEVFVGGSVVMVASGEFV